MTKKRKPGRPKGSGVKPVADRMTDTVAVRLPFGGRKRAEQAARASNEPLTEFLRKSVLERCNTVLSN